MPDAETPEQKAAREAEEARDKRLMEGIAVGVREGLKPMMKEFQEREPIAPVRTETIATITRPTAEQLADALIDGNKQEYARLLKLQEAANAQDLRRELNNLSAQGSAAISSVAQGIAEQNPDYKRFKPEVDKEISQFKSINPGAIVTNEHIRIATEIVKSRHIDEIVNERIEEQRRQQQEREQALLPDNEHHEERAAKEPTNLIEALDVPDWKLYKEKHRLVGGRTDEEELRSMTRKLGLKREGGFQDFLAQRKEIDAVESQVGSGMGLDRDWVWTDKAKGEGHWVN